ncbi:MAG: aspartate--tRNA ligase [Actinomycetota bacterium]
MRTDMCGALRAPDAGREVTLCGWVWRQRDHGGVTFVDLRDREGHVQLVFHPEEAPEAHAAAQAFKAESVVRVTGEVRLRPEGTVNPELPTGEVEVAAGQLQVLSAAETPPFPIEDRIEASEELRLRHRYLDLRRPEMTRVLELRHRVNRIIREEMDTRGFLEVETPLLTRSTPEGARDFLVPSRLSPGTFYALPQSPQQLKQLLMVAGQDRYYQVVRCLRDEQPRADRSFEFTQLDVEMSFVDEEDVFAVIEPIYARILREVHGVDVPTPFLRMTYAEMMSRYGTDKPDLRYGDEMRIADLADDFGATGFNAFRSVLADAGVIRGFSAAWPGEPSRKDLKDLETYARGRGAAGLAWFRNLGEGRLEGPIAKFLSVDEVAAIVKKTGSADGDVVFVVADQPGRVDSALDGLRRLMAERLGLAREGEWAFCWLVEPPLFEWSDDEGKWVSAHHPFTAPATDDLDPTTAISRGYDLVLNGYEAGGGSIRIHDPAVQHRVFEVLGLEEAEIQEKFGHLLSAFRYGVPPHGGIAMGIDRLVMLLAGKDSLRDVTAFPKAQSGADPLTGAPAPVSEEQLRELGIAVIAQPAEKEEA